ncbi:piRNA biogenesis protein EXD1 [Psilocybe cubensis]|uniref:PiRNA biogenesis protein EXD1 n=1 Tax=Psilocybe cubensis TaxID=181762 RepID=A0ACB8GR84_PSICU|nr:piRNA biogenesis protein EXD1 [Psilocybe cubensis]KAH9478240.1 piRNA biogenesis protein EXD1 [Psilocybe cubensis]
MPTITLVDDLLKLDTCLADISSLGTTKLAVDLEGVDLCRHGKVSLLQILSYHSNIIWIIDITVLGKAAFDHTTAYGSSLRGVLESQGIVKVFFDVRNDADSLYHLFGVNLTNTYDLQVLEIAARRSQYLRVKFVTGLGKCIEQYLNPTPQWKRVKEEGIALFQPKQGGSFEVFETRPLDPRVQAYSAQDVELLFQLEAALESQLEGKAAAWKSAVIRISAERVAEAHNSVYAGHGQHRAIAPNFAV